MKISGIKSSAEFIVEIESIVKSKNIEYMDAVLLYCENNNIEVETVASIIKQNSFLKTKIQLEAENLNMVRRTSARLPI